MHTHTHLLLIRTFTANPPNIESTQYRFVDISIHPCQHIRGNLFFSSPLHTKWKESSIHIGRPRYEKNYNLKIHFLREPESQVKLILFCIPSHDSRVELIFRSSIYGTKIDSSRWSNFSTCSHQLSISSWSSNTTVHRFCTNSDRLKLLPQNSIAGNEDDETFDWKEGIMLIL